MCCRPPLLGTSRARRGRRTREAPQRCGARLRERMSRGEVRHERERFPRDHRRQRAQCPQCQRASVAPYRLHDFVERQPRFRDGGIDGRSRQSGAAILRCQLRAPFRPGIPRTVRKARPKAPIDRRDREKDCPRSRRPANLRPPRLRGVSAGARWRSRLQRWRTVHAFALTGSQARPVAIARPGSGRHEHHQPAAAPRLMGRAERPTGRATRRPVTSGPSARTTSRRPACSLVPAATPTGSACPGGRPVPWIRGCRR